MKQHQETPTMDSQSGTGSVSLYAVQCAKCFQWRVIPTQEEFEDLRSKFSEDPFFCNKKHNVFCSDPADIEYNATRTWIMDKPNLPKTPTGFKRQLVVRRDYSKLDAYYVTPTGKRLRSLPEIAAYIKTNSELKGLATSQFSFQSPKVMENTIPDDIERKGSANRNKKKKIMKDEDV